MALEDSRGDHVVATTIEVDEDCVLVRCRVGAPEAEVSRSAAKNDTAQRHGNASVAAA
jgi:hypothetical protein